MTTLAHRLAAEKAKGREKFARHISPDRIAPLAPELVENEIALAEILYRQLLLFRDIDAVMLLGDAIKRRLDLGARHSRLRTATHPLDRFVEKGWIAAKRVWEIELLSPIHIACTASPFSGRRRRHADRQFLATNDLADRQLHRVAKIDRDGQAAFAILQRGCEVQ